MTCCTDESIKTEVSRSTRTTGTGGVHGACPMGMDSSFGPGLLARKLLSRRVTVTELRDPRDVTEGLRALRHIVRRTGYSTELNDDALSVFHGTLIPIDRDSMHHRQRDRGGPAARRGRAARCEPTPFTAIHGVRSGGRLPSSDSGCQRDGNVQMKPATWGLV